MTFRARTHTFCLWSPGPKELGTTASEFKSFEKMATLPRQWVTSLCWRLDTHTEPDAWDFRDLASFKTGHLRDPKDFAIYEGGSVLRKSDPKKASSVSEVGGDTLATAVPQTWWAFGFLSAGHFHCPACRGRAVSRVPSAPTEPWWVQSLQTSLAVLVDPRIGRGAQSWVSPPGRETSCIAFRELLWGEASWCA